MKKILIIDDDELIIMTLRNVLTKEGFEVFKAENGNIGLELYKTHKPDLVITDMLMPDKEGLETISELKAIAPNCKIIAMSGGGSTQNMTFLELAKKIGADRVMQKPVRPADIIQTVKGLMNS